MMKTQVPSTRSKNLRTMDAVKLPGRLTLNRYFSATQRVEKRPESAAFKSLKQRLFKIGNKDSQKTSITEMKSNIVLL